MHKHIVLIFLSSLFHIDTHAHALLGGVIIDPVAVVTTTTTTAAIAATTTGGGGSGRGFSFRLKNSMHSAYEDQNI